MVPAKGNETNTISFGEIKSGGIAAPAQTNFYTFTASSNDVIYLALLRTNGGTFPAFYLYDPDGIAVLGNYTSDFATLENHRQNERAHF